MDDDKEIIYIALINQIESYKEVLEDTENSLNTEEKELAQYILMRTLELEKKFYQEIANNSSDEDLKIQRPQWDL